MSKSNRLSRVSALEERAGIKRPQQPDPVDERATAALIWLLDEYREKFPQHVAAIEAAAQHKGTSDELLRAFAARVVDLLELVDSNHRDRFFGRSGGSASEPARRERATTLSDDALLDVVGQAIGQLKGRPGEPKP